MKEQQKTIGILFDTPFSEEKKITDVPEEFDDSKKISFDKAYAEKIYQEYTIKTPYSANKLLIHIK